jgi:hypothetical protein
LEGPGADCENTVTFVFPKLPVFHRREKKFKTSRKKDGLHMIPRKVNNWTIIFSKDYQSLGEFSSMINPEDAYTEGDVTP